MAKKKNKSKTPVKQDVPEAVKLSDLETTTSSDADTVIAVAPIDEPIASDLKSPGAEPEEVPDYKKIVAAAVIEPMLPPDPMTCTAQELADWKQFEVHKTN